MAGTNVDVTDEQQVTIKQNGSTKPNLNNRDNDDVNRKLWEAARLGLPEELGSLLASEKRVFLDSRDEYGYTAVMLSARAPNRYTSTSERLETLQILLAAGADVDARHQNGATALALAAGDHFFKGVELLLDAGAKVNNLGQSLTYLCCPAETIRCYLPRCGQIPVDYEMYQTLSRAGQKIDFPVRIGVSTPAPLVRQCVNFIRRHQQKSDPETNRRVKVQELQILPPLLRDVVLHAKSICRTF